MAISGRNNMLHSEEAAEAASLDIVARFTALEEVELSWATAILVDFDLDSSVGARAAALRSSSDLIPFIVARL